MPSRSMGSIALDSPTLKEYCKFPSLLLRELKGYAKLSSGAKDVWEILYDLAKFDTHCEVEVSIEKLREIRNCKSRRTIELNLKNLESHHFIKKIKSYSKIGSQLINTYRVLIPIEIAERLTNSHKKVSIKPKNPIVTSTTQAKELEQDHSNTIESIESEWITTSFEGCELPSTRENISFSTAPPENNYGPFNDYLEEININNCCFSNDEVLEESKQEIVEPCISKTEETHSEVLVYYPSKEKPASLGKAVLRHMLTAPIQFEAHINQQLTQAQEAVIEAIISFWKAARYVSSVRDCYDWIKSLLLNPKALSQCGNRFLQRINVINKLIREKRFSKPFVERYRSNTAYKTEQKQRPSGVLKQADRLSSHDQAKQSILSQCEEVIARTHAKLAALRTDATDDERSPLLSIIEAMRHQMQATQYA